MATSIVVAEDHPFLRDGLRCALEKAPSVRLVGEAADGEAALHQIRSLRPDVAILDIGLPKMDGVALVRRIREERLPVEVVFLTICDDEAIFEEALELGVRGYLLKDCTESELLRCIAAVTAGQHYTSPSMTTYMANRIRRTERFARDTPGLHLLTSQERAILRRIGNGQSSKDIALDMRIAPKTVDAHRASICNKLEIHGQYVLTRFAARHRTEI
ncbi:MAG: response regulator [Vicinamibacterales bacterium]